MNELFILKHKNPKFSGYQLGVGFHNGRGTTSSQRDARILVEKGICRDTAKEEEAKKKKAEVLIEKKEAKKAKDEAKKESEKAEKKAEKSKVKEKK